MNIFDQDLLVQWFRTYYFLFLGGLFLGTFFLTWYLIPKVLWVTKEKQLHSDINSRSSHSNAVPSFGGVAFFITVIMVLSLLQTLRLNFVGDHLIAAITILFMVGLKDDLVISTAKAKFVGQLFAAGFIVFSPEMHLTSLYGFCGIYELPPVVGYFLTAFIIVAVINAFNLIDGIDGLAALTGICVSGVFAYVFYLTQHPYFVLIGISVAGILSGFLRYNLSRGHRKIFMGDSGSLVIGLMLAFLAIKFLVMEPYIPMVKLGYFPGNRPLLLACILFLPIFDTLRVMLIRLINGNSPFSADRNHAHHVLLDLGFSHIKASGILAFINLTIIAVFYLFSNLLSPFWLSFLVVSMYATVFLVFFRLKLMGASEARRTMSSYQ